MPIPVFRPLLMEPLSYANNENNIAEAPLIHSKVDKERTAPCCCQVDPEAKVGRDENILQQSAKSAGSVFVSILIAFFPKCPVCWAAYMSMFGSFSLSNLPYQGWMYPVLLSFLGLHLYLVFRSRSTKGYGPFLISLLGASLLISIRLFSIDGPFILYGGMLCILMGSLWNSFRLPSIIRPSIINTKLTHNSWQE